MKTSWQLENELIKALNRYARAKERFENHCRVTDYGLYSGRMSSITDAEVEVNGLTRTDNPEELIIVAFEREMCSAREAVRVVKVEIFNKMKDLTDR